MKKKIIFSGPSNSANVGGALVTRHLPNRFTIAVGPFILLDQAGPLKTNAHQAGGTGPHPHRGIATLTYSIQGQIEHFDSLGNHALVNSGGLQWMNAGNGIVHDERSGSGNTPGDKEAYAFQFWINLPGKIKQEKPKYLPIQANEVPEKQLTEDAGIIRVIAGDYLDLKAKIPAYSAQFLYHIQLRPGKQFSLAFPDKTEVAAILPNTSAKLNNETFQQGDFIQFDSKTGDIDLINNADTTTDILLFGGEKYEEPIVSKGPFVMNSEKEIAMAYQEYAAGKYGEIHYPL